MAELLPPPSCLPLLHPSSHPIPSRSCPHVLTVHKAKQHIKADCAMVALNQASFALNCFPRRGRNKIRRQKERRRRRRMKQGLTEQLGWSEQRVTVALISLGCWLKPLRVELRDVSIAPPPNHPEKLSPFSVTGSANRHMSWHHKLNSSVCIYWSRTLDTHTE